MRFLKNLVPIAWRHYFRMFPTYYYDMKRYYRSTLNNKENKKYRLIAAIIRDYHVIEKGLTMPDTRKGFGTDRMHKLIGECKEFIRHFGTEEPQLQHAIGVILEYKQFHDMRDYKLDAQLETELKHFEDLSPSILPTTQKQLTRQEYLKNADASFAAFANSRASLRNFTNEEIAVDVIMQAVDVARSTPSVCNRQNSKVYLYSERDQMEKILEVQGGNRGFGHLANKLLVVVCDTAGFFGLGERNQAWVDGGMFAMNLLLALHHFKIGACILNCSNTFEKDLALRKICHIKDSEVFIAMIACGGVPEQFKLASSLRFELSNYLKI